MNAWHRLNHHWQSRSTRERQVLKIGAAVLGLLLWTMGIILPSLRIVQSAPDEWVALRQTGLLMKQQAQALKQWRAQPPRVDAAAADVPVAQRCPQIHAGLRCRSVDGAIDIELTSVPASVVEGLPIQFIRNHGLYTASAQWTVTEGQWVSGQWRLVPAAADGGLRP